MITSYPARARIRVTLITFRRPQLLPRAIASLRAQSFTDWICEVQNGDPDDGEPARFLARIGDPRFVLRTPDARIGPVAAFNLAHQPAAEPYQSILEDDNWWEPGFLATLLAALEANPDVELAWSNMAVWRESPDGGWNNTGRAVWNVPADAAPLRLFWPHLLQFNDFLYSNGAMLLRSRAASRLIMPEETPRDMIEHVRERMMTFPILLVPRPLANFALTLRTFRSTDYTGWGVAQALLGAAFLRHVPMSPAARRAFWMHRGAARPRSTSTLIHAALLARRFDFLRDATLADWARFVAGTVRRPRVFWRIITATRTCRPTWELLCALTAARTAEAQRRGFTEIALPSLLDKQHPVGLEVATTRVSA